MSMGMNQQPMCVWNVQYAHYVICSVHIYIYIYIIYTHVYLIYYVYSLCVAIYIAIAIATPNTQYTNNIKYQI